MTEAKQKRPPKTYDELHQALTACMTLQEAELVMKQAKILRTSSRIEHSDLLQLRSVFKRQKSGLAFG